jgi:succinate dehydrogenase hydrophobic anchor subunit
MVKCFYFLFLFLAILINKMVRSRLIFFLLRFSGILTIIYLIFSLIFNFNISFTYIEFIQFFYQYRWTMYPTITDKSFLV